MMCDGKLYRGSFCRNLMHYAIWYFLHNSPRTDVVPTFGYAL